jgi:hypothetical protein
MSRHTFTSLQQQAIAAAESRGHRLWAFRRDGVGTSFAHCAICRREVTVNIHPPPNGIAIGGEAVAVECETAVSDEALPAAFAGA